MSNSEPVAFDPYHFPNFTAKSLNRDITFMVFGAALYEVFMCLHLYLTICNKAKLKSGIFQLITVAVFPLTIALLISFFVSWNLTQEDAIMPLIEYNLRCTELSFIIISKIGYYIAATLRTRALLTLFPRILYGVYTFLATCIINNLVLLGLLLTLSTILVNATPETFLQILSQTADLQMHIFNSMTVTTIFDMVLANALIISFLCPIFAAMETSLFPAVRTMIKLGDVQKALISSLSSIVVVILSFTSLYSIASHTAFTMFWLHTQNSLFLRLTYFSTCELLSQNSTTRVAVQTVYSTGYSTEKLKDSRGVRWETIIGTSSTV